MKLIEYINQYKEMIVEKEDYEMVLRRLRNNEPDWRENVKQDKRRSVAVLLEKLVLLEEEMDRFESIDLIDSTRFES